ncbi:MAG: GerMN domain-containing protein [Epulopiscium sp.]|nr:GerMN domain-containing protein [Candidatus Epulonipiscium sp.]
MKKIIFFGCIFLFFFGMNMKVQGKEEKQVEENIKAGIYLYEMQVNLLTDIDPMVWIEIPLETQMDEKEQISKTLQFLFKWSEEGDRYSCIPQGTYIIDVSLEEGDCIINLSKEILQYGGTYFEKMLSEQLLSTIFAFPQVQKMTLLIEGNHRPLTEGTELCNLERRHWEGQNKKRRL